MRHTSIISADTAGVTLTEFGLQIPRALAFEEWRGILQQAKRAKSAYLSIISDVIRYGRTHFGDDQVNDTLEQLEFDLTDATRAEVISLLPLEQRTLHRLSGEHAYVIGHLCQTAEDRLRWSEACHTHQLTAFELKKSIIAGKVLREAEITERAGHAESLPSIQAVRFQFQKWQRQFSQEDLLKLPKKERRQILHMLTPIVQVAGEIESSLRK